MVKYKEFEMEIPLDLATIIQSMHCNLMVIGSESKIPGRKRSLNQRLMVHIKAKTQALFFLPIQRGFLLSNHYVLNLQILTKNYEAFSNYKNLTQIHNTFSLAPFCTISNQKMLLMYFIKF